MASQAHYDAAHIGVLLRVHLGGLLFAAVASKYLLALPVLETSLKSNVCPTVSIS